MPPIGLIDMDTTVGAQSTLDGLGPPRSQSPGGMFWLCRNRFVGSHTFFSAVNLAYFSGPKAAAMRPWPSSPM